MIFQYIFITFIATTNSSYYNMMHQYADINFYAFADYLTLKICYLRKYFEYKTLLYPFIIP